MVARVLLVPYTQLPGIQVVKVKPYSRVKAVGTLRSVTQLSQYDTVMIQLNSSYYSSTTLLSTVYTTQLLKL